jgi:hypothetical protein
LLDPLVAHDAGGMAGSAEETSVEPEPLARAPASHDTRDRIIGAIKRVEETVFVPVFSVLLSSPIWGPLVAWQLEWPLWLGILVSVIPCASLFLAGVMHVALRHYTEMSRARASSLELPLVIATVLCGVVAPIAIYYS